MSRRGLFTASASRVGPGAPAGVASPCVSVCRMNAETGLCEGCLRTIDEIAGWSSFDDATRQSVLRAIETRRAHASAADRDSPVGER
jgi:uncharacterized protein